MVEMKGISLCGECGNYDWKKHRCKLGCNDESDPRAKFYGDCPLPDVAPRAEVAREIFAEIEKQIGRNLSWDDHMETYGVDTSVSYKMLAELKKKYVEGE